MHVAFYAPLKAPDHHTPSGDRAMAQGLIAALKHCGATITLASTLRTRDGVGDAAVQQDLFKAAAAEVARLTPLGQAENWCAWITYHNYYKAPDLIGPAIARALDIPYLLIESSRARKRLTGPWAEFATAAEAASDAADVIFYLTHRDAETLERDRPADQILIHLPPFLNRLTLPAASSHAGPMLSVGMMRPGDKLASYSVIAETLALLPKETWALQIVGDGTARPQVEALMSPYGSAVQFLGQLDADAVAQVYGNAALLFWPGVNEAFGLVYLEAQAAGLPIVAQDRPGVRDILGTGIYPAPSAGAAPLAERISAFLRDPDLSRDNGARARAHVARHHLLPAATDTLLQGLAACGVYP